MIPLAKPTITKDMIDAAINALQNEYFVLGDCIYKFEEEFAKYCEADYAVAVSSGTHALQFALISAEIKNAEIITTPMSFIATANSAIHSQNIPKFVDINNEDWNIEPKNIKVTDKTKAIIPVDLYGNPCKIDEINEIAEKNNLVMIEDACQAHGALYKNHKIGSLAEFTCFSFYSTKNLTVGGDGGMVVLNNEKYAEKIRKLRDCGRVGKYLHDCIGYTARLNTVNAAIGRVQLKYLDSWNEKRLALANYYIKKLQTNSEITLQVIDSQVKAVYHLFAIRAKFRDSLQNYLKEKGIGTGVHYNPPIHLQPIYKQL